MNYCNLIPSIYIKDAKLCDRNGMELNEDAAALCEKFENDGADEVMITEFSHDDEGHEKNIGLIKEIADRCDIPILLGGNINRLEDIKKYLYAGAKMAVLDVSKTSNVDLIRESSSRFGTDRIAVLSDKNCSDDEMLQAASDYAAEGASLFITSNRITEYAAKQFSKLNISLLITNPEMSKADIKEISENTDIYGVSSVNILGDGCFMERKQELKEFGICVNVFESSIAFCDFKLNSDEMIPVVVQDYKTNEVLMVAYMNEEAFNLTVRTGKMTYFSRSRNEIWVKGLTSGHFQYVKALDIDCDKDTLLAKVKQIGAACHTGNRSCFFTPLVKKEYDEANPLKVFEEVFDVIKDRKLHPKEGSYTNYLFDKGIDKILKKVGEEATEIVIAAKNPDKEEIKYEISDFLYHVMVLMAEKDVSWKDITKELARR